MLYGISCTLSEIEQRDSAQHDSEQRGLRADLPLAEHQRARDERDDDARAPDRRNDRQQGLRIAQRVKVTRKSAAVSSTAVRKIDHRQRKGVERLREGYHMVMTMAIIISDW